MILQRKPPLSSTRATLEEIGRGNRSAKELWFWRATQMLSTIDLWLSYAVPLDTAECSGILLHKSTRCVRKLSRHTWWLGVLVRRMGFHFDDNCRPFWCFVVSAKLRSAYTKLCIYSWTMPSCGYSPPSRSCRLHGERGPSYFAAMDSFQADIVANVLKKSGKQGKAAAGDNDSNLNLTVARLDSNKVKRERSQWNIFSRP